MEREERCWSSHSEAMLQVALDDVDWDMFRVSSSDVSEFTDVALSFVNMLNEQATETVTTRTFSNQKPWVDRTIRDAVNHRTAAYNAGLRRELKRVNVRKAAGPDGITGYVLRSCADQLAGLFTSIFNESLATSVIPTSFKKSVIIPVPKNSKPSCLIDYSPVALTSIVMKVFERPLKNHICTSIPATLDPLQFAYRPNRSTDNAISQVLHSSLTHIDSKNGNYVRLLFIDYSSAFNTIVPIKLAVKLTDLGLNSSLCDWIQEFLTDRPQVVKMGQFTSNSITLNIGAPQGCVLSPLLYSLYTHDCVSSHSSTSIVKFADDTVILGLISNNDETAYLDEVDGQLSLSEREQN